MKTYVLAPALLAAAACAMAQSGKETKPVPILQQSLTTPGQGLPAAAKAKPAGKAASVPGGPAVGLQGQGDFAGQSASRLVTSDADYTCQRLYDSASPVSMVAELTAIVGQAEAEAKLAKLMGRPAPDNRKLFDQLRQLAKTKIWLPVDMERQVGEVIHKKVVKDGEVIAEADLNNRDAARLAEIRSALAALTAALPKDNPYQFTLNVVRGDLPNASVNVGGFVYVTQGMLRDRSLRKDDIALRLAHESAHLTRRHVLKAFQLKLVDIVAISKDLPTLTRIVRDPVQGVETLLATRKAVELLFARFEHNQELEADACGTFVMQRTPGYQPQRAITAMLAQNPSTPMGQWWENSHPAYAERETVMKMQLSPEQASRPMPESISAVASAGVSQPIKGLLPAQTLAPGTGGAAAAAGGGAGAGAGAAEAPAEGGAAKSGVGGFFNRIKGMLPAGGASAPAAVSAESPQ
jgi:hypothetical protein